MYLRAAPVPTCRRINVNLVCKREVVGPGLKSVGVVGPKISTDVCTYSTGLKVSSPESLFIYTQIFLFMKSHHFVKCSYLTFLHITGYTNISWRPRNPAHDSSIIKSGWSRRLTLLRRRLLEYYLPILDKSLSCIGAYASVKAGPPVSGFIAS